MSTKSKSFHPAHEPLEKSLAPPFSRKRATKRDVAREYKVSLSTVNSWMARKLIPHIKIGYVVRFDLDAVDRALERFTVKEVS